MRVPIELQPMPSRGRFNMTTPQGARANPFVHGPLGPIFLRTSIPIMLMTLTNGIQSLVDAWFLGVFVGANALAAVTLIFPLFMLLVALSSLVSAGMASMLARALGAGDIERARALFVGAHGLSILVCGVLIGAFLAAGKPLASWLANDSAALAGLGYDYISIIVLFSPIMFFLGVNGDALRCEGKLALMMLATIVVTAANVLLTYLLVVVFEGGIAAAAIGTVLAQALALAIVVVYRSVGSTALRWRSLRYRNLAFGWRDFLALGAPQSLSFIGLSLVSTAIIISVQHWSGEGYAASIAAYGIIMRMMTFAYMPLMGMNMTTQTIAGNNFGAGLHVRSDHALRLGLTVAVVYALVFQVCMIVFAGTIGRWFVTDPDTIAEVGRIMPITVMLYVVSAVMLILSGYLQAIGDARTAILLTVGRTYLFTIPLILALPFALGEAGIWVAGPVADLCTAMLAAWLLSRKARREGYRFGVFKAASGG
jgi:putative MATE family efflux protein